MYVWKECNILGWPTTKLTLFCFFVETIVQKLSLKHFIRAPSVRLGRCKICMIVSWHQKQTFFSLFLGWKSIWWKFLVSTFLWKWGRLTFNNFSPVCSNMIVHVIYYKQHFNAKVLSNIHSFKTAPSINIFSLKSFNPKTASSKKFWHVPTAKKRRKDSRGIPKGTRTRAN